VYSNVASDNDGGSKTL